MLAFYFTDQPECAYDPSGTQVNNNLLRAFPQRLSDLSFHLLYIPFRTLPMLRIIGLPKELIVRK
ncbi:hypothetical protein CXF51_10435 [Bacillus subtilis subsp. subtilis]|nr:hypothetical protein CXF51_10435 [Bacillus subtilis subsp. subtilis]